ncbi:MAG: hypothetical protein M3P22_02320, partial [bacterium]|nr:hypothetical protein [bacterium]
FMPFTKKEILLIQKLNTPAKIQDFINSIPFNFEKNGETIMSPIRAMHANKMHCMEGALFSAYILSIHGYKPLILHLKSTREDFDHIITLFQIDGFWGALSKTNHAALRYREPVYKNVRELVLSYFHEYFLNNTGQKTLRSYSRPLDLNIFKNKKWWLAEEDLWYIDEKLDKIKHYDIAPQKSFKNLRKADNIERKMGSFVEFTK